MTRTFSAVFPLGCILLVFAAFDANPQEERTVPQIAVGRFGQEIAQSYTTDQGLPDNDVRAIAAGGGRVYAATAKGLAVFERAEWRRHPALGDSDVVAVAANEEGEIAAMSGSTVYLLDGRDILRELETPSGSSGGSPNLSWGGNDRLILQTSGGVFTVRIASGMTSFSPLGGSTAVIVEAVGTVTCAAVTASDQVLVGGTGGLLFRDNADDDWWTIFPEEGSRSWAPRKVGAVGFDAGGRSWFASRQGAGSFDETWTLYEGADGLPYNDFTSMAAAPGGRIWFGTDRGAISFDGSHWAYRQGRRWLPNDDVRDVAVSPGGAAWFATAGGVGVIRFQPMTFAEKAEYYESEIDKYHRRTPYGYVLEVSLPAPGEKRDVGRHDSDNDGLWTAMYGAGACFVYGATGDPAAKARAAKAFRALKFLGEVTQGGSNPAPKGFVARTILPTSGHDPNEGRLERDRRSQGEEDSLWKVIDPRWPVSEDGKWYWKSDTSSDELDGHYFLYGLYYDLVAETEEEKSVVRERVRMLTDHIVEHGFNLVDHDGKPTRWGRYSPEELNFSENWFAERGLNSLSMLTYLAVTRHVTGDEKYGTIARRLIDEHGYVQNLMYPKFQRGIGTGNQSDDEMAFMCYYHLLKYERDPELRGRYAMSLWQYWRIVQPELNPFFNFVMASQCIGSTYRDPWGVHDTSPTGEWLEESIDTLKRFPLDRVDWRLTNSHRLDIVRLPAWARGFDEAAGRNRGRGVRSNGKVLPVDERHFNHWNTDPFRLDQGGAGNSLGDGTVFLLPYYMGLYHGFLTEAVPDRPQPDSDDVLTAAHR